MFKERREQYLKFADNHSMTLLFSGHALIRTNDEAFPFSVDRNFYYLTGIDQENVTLLMIKGDVDTKSFLFVDENDPVKVLWTGKTLEKDEAAKIAELDIKDILYNQTLKETITALLSTSRRALYGELKTAYFDLERLSVDAMDKTAHQFSRQLQEGFPYMQIKPCQRMLAKMRMVKSEDEIHVIKQAVAITKDGLNRIMDHLKPDMLEYEIEAEYNYVLNKSHTTPSFKTIAASGKHATVLHYVDNDGIINDGELVLFDLGVEKDFYCSDVTRVFPASGTFTDRQKAIYEVVLEANKKTIAWVKAGITFKEFNDFGKQILIDGAKKLGLIKEDSDITKYYYHSLGHYLGLDVHDVGMYHEPMPEGAVLTVEPGLYIAEEGIGIRIEDDIVLTKDGAINLTKEIVKEVKDIEALIKKSL